MRLNLAGSSIEDQIADLVRDIQELKTAQFTSQNSGMLAHVNGSGLFDAFGDIVEWRYTVAGGGGGYTTPVMTSHIPCPATPYDYYYNTLTCHTQVFVPRHNKPAVAVPYMRVRAEGPGGVHGESEFVVSPGGGFSMEMKIYNGANVQVGLLYCAQHQGDYLEPAYNPSSQYAWESTLFYTSTMPFDLSYKLLVRSSDRGVTSTKIDGILA